MTKRILHVFSDDKFFDIVADFFDSLDGVENLYHFLVPSKRYQFRFIKKPERVRVIHSRKEYLDYFSDPKIDIVYFHSLPHKLYYLFNHIDKEKKVIWWSWGWDIYGTYHLLPPLLKVPRYGSLTQKFAGNYWLSSYCFLRYPYWLMRYFYEVWLRRKVVRRIDCFSPVLPIEYEMMTKQVEGFRAKSFMMRGPGWQESEYTKPKGAARNILIGNSLTKTNNHLEIFEHIRSFRLQESQHYVLPISYGGEYGKEEIKRLAALPAGSAIWLEGFMPREEYETLFAGITHAVFGCLRQQALGNIYMCLSRGVKLFFFKDSIVYRSLTNDGYRVFTIEDDLTEAALQSLLSDEDININHRILHEQFGNRKSQVEKELENI